MTAQSSAVCAESLLSDNKHKNVPVQLQLQPACLLRGFTDNISPNYGIICRICLTVAGQTETQRGVQMKCVRLQEPTRNKIRLIESSASGGTHVTCLQS